MGNIPCFGACISPKEEKRGNNMNEIKRGQIYYIDLDPVQGSEQGGLRPCIIVQNNKGNEHSPATIVVPLTTKWKKKLPTHTIVHETPVTSLALCEQIRTIDKCRIKALITTCSPHTMKQIDLALKTSLGV